MSPNWTLAYVEHLFNLPFHLAADEDEAAGRNVVVCRPDEDGVDELDREDREGSGSVSVRAGEKVEREGEGRAVGRLLKVKSILDGVPFSFS